MVPLDKLRALVVGGCSEGTATPSGAAELWDRKKNTLSALPGPRTHRSAQGACYCFDSNSCPSSQHKQPK